jgi:endonuclease/exonuclease/phosphatase family metal-dependent hydrolase
LTFEHEREPQTVFAARFVEELIGRRGVHVVLAGDFDAAPDAASVLLVRSSVSGGHERVLQGRLGEHASRGSGSHVHRTQPAGDRREPGWARELGRRVDYVFVRCVKHGPTLDVSACARIFDAPVDGVWTSDHFGVVANFTLPAGV